jgi:hypothetical protein
MQTAEHEFRTMGVSDERRKLLAASTRNAPKPVRATAFAAFGR